MSDPVRPCQTGHPAAPMLVALMCFTSLRCSMAAPNVRSTHDGDDRLATMWWRNWSMDARLAYLGRCCQRSDSRMVSLLPSLSFLCLHPCHCPQDVELRRNLLRMDTLLAEMSTAEEDAGRNAACVQACPRSINIAPSADRLCGVTDQLSRSSLFCWKLCSIVVGSTIR